jgi:5'-3' exonuclease
MARASVTISGNFIRQKMQDDPLLAIPSVIFLKCEVPGEGEHKIMEW